MPDQSKIETQVPLVVKLSGEMLSTHNGQTEKPFYSPAVDFIVTEIASLAKSANMALVIGGGNIARGRTLKPNDPSADFPGMEATRVNAEKLRNELEARGVESYITDVRELSTENGHRSIINKLANGTSIILAGGSGWPGVSTDTATVLLAYSLGAKKILKATKVNGVYSKRPEEIGAEILKEISAQEFLDRGLDTIFDPVGMMFAKEKKISIRFFNGFTEGNFARAAMDEDIGSLIKPAA
jgi:uridylate kinase